MFASFEAEPLGTASLAQVHRATLHTGEVEIEILLSWLCLCPSVMFRWWQ